MVFDATGGMPTLKVQVPEDSVSTVHGGNMIKQIMDGNLCAPPLLFVVLNHPPYTRLPTPDRRGVGRAEPSMAWAAAWA